MVVRKVVLIKEKIPNVKPLLFPLLYMHIKHIYIMIKYDFSKSKQYTAPDVV